jgi:hypothetical protein
LPGEYQENHMGGIVLKTVEELKAAKKGLIASGHSH